MSESELSGSGGALSPRQERIAGRLFRQVGLGSAAFFRDACVLVAEVPPRPTTTHLVAHLLREVESSVRSVLEPADASAEAEDGNHKASIRAVLKVLGISPQDWVAELWLGLTGKGGLRGLAPQAHRPGLAVRGRLLRGLRTAGCLAGNNGADQGRCTAGPAELPSQSRRDAVLLLPSIRELGRPAGQCRLLRRPSRHGRGRRKREGAVPVVAGVRVLGQGSG
jgi:hypothetical protein